MRYRLNNTLGLIVGVFIGLAGFLQPLYAQTTLSGENFNIGVTTRLLSSIELVTIQSMRISQAEARNNLIDISPTRSDLAGKMIALGNANAAIRISFFPTQQLKSESGNQTLTFTYKVAGNTEDDQATAEQLDGDNRDLNLNREGKFYIWIGGSVDIGNALPGNYRGEFTLEVEYI